MRNTRPIVQVLLITLITLILTLLAMVILIGEVRQEILRIVIEMMSIPRVLRIPPIVWPVVWGVLALGGVYLLVRLAVYFSIPSLRKAHKCPLCEGRLQRIHRQRRERILTTILWLKVARYGCMNCEWNGLRRYRKHHDE
jgi:hypothetical protein